MTSTCPFLSLFSLSVSLSSLMSLLCECILYCSSFIRSAFTSPKDVVDYVKEPSNWPYLLTGGVSTAAVLYCIACRLLPQDDSTSSASQSALMGRGRKKNKSRPGSTSRSPSRSRSKGRKPKPHPPVSYKPVKLPQQLSTILPVCLATFIPIEANIFDDEIVIFTVG